MTYGSQNYRQGFYVGSFTNIHHIFGKSDNLWYVHFITLGKGHIALKQWVDAHLLYSNSQHLNQTLMGLHAWADSDNQTTTTNSYRTYIDPFYGNWWMAVREEDMTMIRLILTPESNREVLDISHKVVFL